MLGYVTPGQDIVADQLLSDIASDLRAEGFLLAGVTQVNDEYDPERPCHMDLHILTGNEVIRISQNLGSLSKGCRLDPAGLEKAVGLVEKTLETAPHLLIINKFGKQEAEGRGFRPLIGQALSTGIPVLTTVSEGNLAAFLTFADGLAEPLAAQKEPVLAWCRTRTR